MDSFCEQFTKVHTILAEEALSQFLEGIFLWFPPHFFLQTPRLLNKKYQILSTRAVAQVAPANARTATPQRN